MDAKLEQTWTGKVPQAHVKDQHDRGLYRFGYRTNGAVALSTAVARLSPEMCTGENMPAKQKAIVESFLEDVEMSAWATGCFCVR